MKKIYVLLGMLLVLCTVHGWADGITPEFEQHLSVLRNLPREERLEKCKELGSLNGWTKHSWVAMNCSELLPDAPNELAWITYEETPFVSPMLISGIVALLLFGGALLLLLHYRKR